MAKSILFGYSLLTKVFNDKEFYWLPLTDFYLSLHTGDPGVSGNQTTNECDYGDYARVAVPRTPDSWAVIDNEVTNNIEIKFPTCGSGVNTAWYYTIGMEQTGEGGQPMIYGDPKAVPKSFIPQVPQLDTLQECNGLGMGFNLFKLNVFKDPRLPKPFFKTYQNYEPGVGARSYTQDLYFYENAGKLGYRFACDTRIKVGHLDYEADIVW